MFPLGGVQCFEKIKIDDGPMNMAFSKEKKKKL